MIKGKGNHKEEGSKEKKIPFSFSMEDIKGNITNNTNKQSKPSKEQIINQAFKYHSQGNIVEAAKYYKYFIKEGFTDANIFSNYAVILKISGNSNEISNLSTTKPNANIPVENMAIEASPVSISLDCSSWINTAAITLKINAYHRGPIPPSTIPTAIPPKDT